MTDKLCIFISYKRENQDFAKQLGERLESWGYDYWLDVRNIQSGISPQSSTWIDAIHQGLKQCQVLIGVVTPDSLASQNVRDEWYWAREAKRRIILLRLEPFDVQDMPPVFAATDYIDLVVHPDSGFERLKRELATLGHEREAFKATIHPVESAPEALPIPDYLQDTIKPKRGVPWRLTLRVIALLVLLISFIWLILTPDFEPLLAFLGAVAAFIGSFVGEQSADGDLKDRDKLSDIEQMRKRVYQYWVKGVMQTALAEVERAAIGLNMQPEAVLRDNARNIGDIVLPNNSRYVRRVYDTFTSFLILGDPGAGKTIMLLQLAENLILSPPPTHKNAIPLMLNLSSWSLTQKPLHEWLEDETWRSYRVRGSRVRDWLKDNRLILLLDGLDEVKEEIRVGCVSAINEFRQSYKHVPMVVCSRIRDYERLGDSKLQLEGAILLEQLTDTQVDGYLKDAQLQHLKNVMADDPILREMARTPFLLNTMIYAYRHLPEDALRGYDTEATRREHLFDTYVQRRLQDKPSPWGYDKTIQYLRWLATKMQAYVQTVFHPDDIDLNWVADDPFVERLPQRLDLLRWAYVPVLMILYVLVGWMLGGVLGALAWGAAGLLVGYGIADVQHFSIRSPRAIISELKDIPSEGRLSFGYLILAPAIIMLASTALNPYLVDWLVVGGISAVLGVFLPILLGRDDFDTRRELLLTSLMFGGIFVPVGIITWSIASILSVDVSIKALILTIITAILSLHLILFEDQKDEPTKNTYIGWAFPIGLVFGVVGWLAQGQTLGILLGLAAFVTYFGLFNGLTILQQPIVYRSIIRARIIGQDLLPLRINRLLHTLTSRQIMREMGGGYIFIHRYLLENFAGLDEIYILLAQLRTEERRNHAITTLTHLIEETPQTTVRAIQSAIAWDRQDVHPVERRFGLQLLRDNGFELADNRPGIGVIVRDSVALPDIDWVTIPAGEFIYQDNQKITLPTFQISRYPVTYAQFQAFIDAPEGFHDPRWWKGLAMPDGHNAAPGDQAFKFWNHPRESVSWYDAIAFCRWFSWRLGGGYELDKIAEWAVRLPTEFEWEKAARGTNGLIYPYGNEFDANKGNTSETGIGQTSAVGIFPQGASPYGVQDMSGNVWEWCLTDYNNPALLAEKENIHSSARRVLRGGSWGDDYNFARAASRHDYFVGHLRDNFIGFRIVRPPSVQP